MSFRMYPRAVVSDGGQTQPPRGCTRWTALFELGDYLSSRSGFWGLSLGNSWGLSFWPPFRLGFDSSEPGASGLLSWPFRLGFTSSEPGAWGLSFWPFRLGLASSGLGAGGLTRVLSSRRSSE